MKRIIVALIVPLSLPLVANAAEALRVTSNDTAPPRFFPLDSAHNGNTPRKIKSLQEANVRHVRPLRSDAEAMNNGFMRIDRNSPAPMPPQHALIVYPPQEHASDAPRIIRGGSASANRTTIPTDTAVAPIPTTPLTRENADPVLALFNTNDSAALPTFRDGLSGRVGSATVAPIAGDSTHQWPLPANITKKITSGFGYRSDPIDKKMEFHNGIDISAAMGTPVLASADGKVTEVASDGLFGQSIAIVHNDGSESQYGHLSAQNVTVGQQVKAGQMIGKVGATGRVTGAHLHYCISRNGIKMDPMKLLGQPASIETADASSAQPASHIYPGSPVVTRPRPTSRSEKLIIVR